MKYFICPPNDNEPCDYLQCERIILMPGMETKKLKLGRSYLKEIFHENNDFMIICHELGIKYLFHNFPDKLILFEYCVIDEKTVRD